MPGAQLDMISVTVATSHGVTFPFYFQNILAQRQSTAKTHQSNRSESLAQPAPRRKPKAGQVPQPVTHATLNRMREQQRVERENLVRA